MPVDSADGNSIVTKRQRCNRLRGGAKRAECFRRGCFDYVSSLNGRVFVGGGRAMRPEQFN